MRQKPLTIGLICGLFLMISCLPTRQSTVFREMKRDADTLIVISPYLEITAFDFREKTFDSELTEKNQEIIARATNQLLSSKYALKHIEMPEINRDRLMALFYDLDKASNLENKQQTFFPTLNNINSNQLAIFLVFHAEYNSVTKAISGNSMMGTSYVRITPAARPHSDLRLVVFNLQTHEIVFYNKYDTRNYSASSPADMERMTRKILRDLYYK
jgi:hypothetical protein